MENGSVNSGCILEKYCGMHGEYLSAPTQYICPSKSYDQSIQHMCDAYQHYDLATLRCVSDTCQANEKLT